MPDCTDRLVRGSVAAAKYFPGPYRFSIGSVWSSDGHKILDIRGWGRLTGGAMPDRLKDHEVAGSVQDAIGEWIAHVLNSANA